MPNLVRITAGLCVVAGLFGLFYLGTLPGAGELFPEPWDKLAHFAVFAGLSVCLMLMSANSAPWAVFFAVSLIGALDEWHQVYLPGRHSDIYDFLTDVIAAAVACTYMALRKRNARPFWRLARRR
jgi:VanZ family protein